MMGEPWNHVPWDPYHAHTLSIKSLIQYGVSMTDQ